jgi:hypothetical protein
MTRGAALLALSSVAAGCSLPPHVSPGAGGGVRIISSNDGMHGRPYGIVVDATSIYWTTTFTAALNPPEPAWLMKAPLAGGAPVALAMWRDDTSVNPHLLAVNDTTIYWTNFLPTSGSLMSMPIGGGAVTTLVENQNNPHALVIDKDNVYWTNYSDGTVVKMPLAGGEVTPLAIGQALPNMLAIDGTNVYWTTSGGGTVMQTPLDGNGPLVTIASNQVRPYGVVVDATNVYWTTSGSPPDGGPPNGTVMKQALAGGPPVALASSQNGPYNIAIDATNVYWSNFPNDNTSVGALMTVPIAGGTPTVLASADSFGIAVDDTSLYWTDYLSGVVEKLTPK